MTRLLMTTDAVGGVWQYATELAGALRPLGVETTLAVMGPSGDTPSAFPLGFAERASSLSQREREGAPKARKGEGVSADVEVVITNLPLDWLASGPTAVADAGDAIARLADEVQADIVHLNSPALAAHTDFARPVVAVAHGCVGTWWRACRGGAPDPAFAWHGELMARGLARADAAVAPSASFAAALHSAYGLATTPLVVHNGRTPHASSHGEPADHVFTAGRLWDEAKNTAVLDAIAALLPVALRAAGSLRAPHGETVAPKHLTALGPIDDAAITRELAVRPIYVSAARFEPFGLSVLEAANAGCPLVLSNIDTFRELWTGAALLVAPDDAAAYAAAIQRLRADPALRAHLGEAARLRAERYRPAIMATRMAGIYDGLLSRPAQVAA